MTRVRALLCALFDTSAAKVVYQKYFDFQILIMRGEIHGQLKIDERAFQTPSGRKIELTVFSSAFHVEVNPSEVGIYNRVVVQEVIKEFAHTQQLDRTKHAFKSK